MLITICNSALTQTPHFLSMGISGGEGGHVPLVAPPPYHTPWFRFASRLNLAIGHRPTCFLRKYALIDVSHFFEMTLGYTLKICIMRMRI